MAKDWREIWDTATYEEWKKTLIAGGRQSGKSDAYEYYWSNQIYDTELEEKVDQAIWDMVCDKPEEVITVDHILRLKEKFTYQLRHTLFGKISITTTPTVPNPFWGLHQKQEEDMSQLTHLYSNHTHRKAFEAWRDRHHTFPQIEDDVSRDEFLVEYKFEGQRTAFHKWFQECQEEAGVERESYVCPYKSVAQQSRWMHPLVNHNASAILADGPVDTILSETKSFDGGLGIKLRRLVGADGVVRWEGTRKVWNEIISKHQRNRNQPGVAGDNNRSDDMTDYTSTVQGQLDERDRANKEIEKQQLKIIRDITSKIGDLAVIHTDDSGVLDRFSLGTSLDKSLIPYAFTTIDQMEDLEED